MFKAQRQNGCVVVVCRTISSVRSLTFEILLLVPSVSVARLRLL